MDDNKLAAEEARRSVQHESVKAQVEGDVNAEIASASQPRSHRRARRERLDRSPESFALKQSTR